MIKVKVYYAEHNEQNKTISISGYRFIQVDDHILYFLLDLCKMCKLNSPFRDSIIQTVTSRKPCPSWFYELIDFHDLMEDVYDSMYELTYDDSTGIVDWDDVDYEESVFVYIAQLLISLELLDKHDNLRFCAGYVVYIDNRMVFSEMFE